MVPTACWIAAAAAAAPWKCHRLAQYEKANHGSIASQYHPLLSKPRSLHPWVAFSSVTRWEWYPAPCLKYLKNLIWRNRSKNTLWAFCTWAPALGPSGEGTSAIRVVARLLFIQRLVDMPLPIHVEATVRCKSIHLLSLAYPQSLTPKSKHQQHQLHTISNFELAPRLPSLMNHNHQLNEVLTSLDTSHISVSTIQQQQQQQQPTASSPSLSSPIAVAKLALQPRVERSMSMPHTMNKSPSWVERFVNDSILLIIHEHAHDTHMHSKILNFISGFASYYHCYCYYYF